MHPVAEHPHPTGLNLVFLAERRPHPRLVTDYWAGPHRAGTGSREASSADEWVASLGERPRSCSSARGPRTTKEGSTRCRRQSGRAFRLYPTLGVVPPVSYTHLTLPTNQQ